MAIKATSQITLIDVTDAYNIMLTSETYTFPGNTSGAAAGNKKYHMPDRDNRNRREQWNPIPYDYFYYDGNDYNILRSDDTSHSRRCYDYQKILFCGS